MTNAEKYLKDGVDVKELSRELCEFIKEYYGLIMGNVHGLAGFWLMPCKPTLTEDERVILRNADKEWKTIARPFKHNLEFRDSLPEANKIIRWSSLEPFNHLFQFIKERRRI